MLYILHSVEWRENRAAPAQEPDTWRREPDAAGNPEGAHVRKPQDPRAPIAPSRPWPQAGHFSVSLPREPACARVGCEQLTE